MATYKKDVVLPRDGPVEHRVDNSQNNKRDKSHYNKVGQQDVVLDVPRIVPQLGRTNGKLNFLFFNTGINHPGVQGVHHLRINTLLGVVGTRPHTSIQFIPSKNNLKRFRHGNEPTKNNKMHGNGNPLYLGIFQTRLSNTVGIM